MATNRIHRIAVIPGDGIGKEVMPEGLRAIESAAKKYRIKLHFDHFDFASYDYYEKHGQMMPDDWRAQIGSHDAILFGAVGWPATASLGRRTAVRWRLAPFRGSRFAIPSAAAN